MLERVILILFPNPHLHVKNPNDILLTKTWVLIQAINISIDLIGLMDNIKSYSCRIKAHLVNFPMSQLDYKKNLSG